MHAARHHETLLAKIYRFSNSSFNENAENPTLLIETAHDAV